MSTSRDHYKQGTRHLAISLLAAPAQTLARELNPAALTACLTRGGVITMMPRRTGVREHGTGAPAYSVTVRADERLSQRGGISGQSGQRRDTGLQRRSRPQTNGRLHSRLLTRSWVCITSLRYGGAQSARDRRGNRRYVRQSEIRLHKATLRRYLSSNGYRCVGFLATTFWRVKL